MRAGPAQARHRTEGFTLVELLVAIAIIAVLAAVLFPVLARARGKARQTQCLSHVRQITTAMLVYAGDHGECLPPATYGRPASQFALPWQSSMDMNWWDIMLPHLGGSRAILFCPAVDTHVPPYRMNQYLADPSNGFLGDVTRPTETFLIVEANQPNEKAQLPLATPVACMLIPLPVDAPFHHFEKMNASFVDGHVKPLGPEAFVFSSPYWPATK